MLDVLKVCKKCFAEKPTSMFKKDARLKDGLHIYCLDCTREIRRNYYKKNRDVELKKSCIKTKIWYLKNKEEVLKKKSEYHLKNREKILSYQKKWRKENTEKTAFLTSLFRAKKKQRTPPWVTKQMRDLMKQEYELAKWASSVIGVKFHVDHIVPLQGETVSGLHVPWNLRVIPSTQNISKRNKIDPSLVETWVA